jgi:hypothetical protein
MHAYSNGPTQTSAHMLHVLFQALVKVTQSLNEDKLIYNYHIFMVIRMSVSEATSL